MPDFNAKMHQHRFRLGPVVKLHVKEEVAERWKRGARRRDERESRRRGGGEWGVGVPLPNRLGGPGECHEFPQRGSGRSPGRKRIWCILWPLEGR